MACFTQQILKIKLKLVKQGLFEKRVLVSINIYLLLFNVFLDVVDQILFFVRLS